MARFYRTSGANPLDYMSRLNVNLMSKVVEANDSYITQNLQQTAQVGNLANSFPFLQQDEEAANGIMADYSKQVDDITAAIRSDPANWRRQLNPIQDLSRKLTQDYKAGQISKIAENYGKYKKTSDYIDEQMRGFNKDGKGISADRARAYKAMFLGKFQGTNYNPATGEYNAINVFDPMNNMDIRKTLSEELDKMKADGDIRYSEDVTKGGEYFNKQTKKWEGISPERILRIATGRLNNPQLMDYLKQDTMAGIVSGVYDTDVSSPNYGQFIAPYSYDKIGLNSSEQSIVDSMKRKIEQTKNAAAREEMETQLQAYTKNLAERTSVNWNNKSYLAPILRGVVDQFSYGKTEEGNDLSNNSLYNTRLTEAGSNARTGANIASRERMQQRAFENQQTLQDARLKAQKELKLMDINKPKAGAKPVPGAKTNTDNNVVGVLHTSPFYWMTERKDKLTTSLNDEINVSKNSVGQLEKALGDLQKNTPDNKIMIANAENQLGSAKNKLASLEGQRENAISFSVNSWKNSSNEIPYTETNEQVVRSYLSGKAKSDYDNANGELKKLEAAKANLDVNSPEYQTFMRNSYYPARSRKAQAEVIFSTGQRIFDKEIKSSADTKLEKAAKETTNRNEIINTTTAQDDMVREMITAAPSNYKIMDANGKETNFSFEHGTAHITDKDFKINGASVTTGLGDKGIELAVSIKGKPYIIIPKDDGNRLNTYLSGEFKKSQSKEVNSIGKILSSPVSGTIADMMTEMRMNTNPQYGSKDSWVYKTIPNPANPSETMKIRSRSINTGGGEPKWEFQVETSNPQLIINSAGKREGYTLKDGKMTGFVPIPTSKSKDGVFHNLEDVLSVFSDQ